MTQAKRIEDYALIGDGETAALIDRQGSIEWLCFPRFDSEACFAALLGDRENGCWSLWPTGEVKAATRQYRGDSLILETEVTTGRGRVLITDFMPIRGEAPDIVRMVEGLEGEVELLSELILRFDYGRLHPLVRHLDDGRAVAMAGPNGVSLHFDSEIAYADRRLCSRFTLRAGEKKRFVLTWFASHLPVPEPVDPDKALADTQAYWNDWSSHISYGGPHRDLVRRSLITLKALTHRPTGGIVAAPTASLPEQPGSGRNWDYRYCWLRDSTLMLLVFTHGGLFEEARSWTAWLDRAVGGEPAVLQPFFSVDGSRRIPEWQAGWLGGFRGSVPVRFGNAAVDQLQLDIYGEVIDALFQAYRNSVPGGRGVRDLLRMLAALLQERWREPDAGIWESRGEPRHHTYSKAMCWVAFDRAAAFLDRCGDRDAEQYRQLAQEVREIVLAQGFDSDANSFTAAFGDPGLDAALLRLPLVGFIDADDPRMVGTVAAIERKLCHDGLVRRYDTGRFDDGIGTPEGAFVAACFWLAEVYHMQGRRADAVTLFERTAGRANDLGLLSEEIALDGSGALLGNFPQGLSHLSLVSAARRLFEPDSPQCDRKAEADPAATAA